MSNVKRRLLLLKASDIDTMRKRIVSLEKDRALLMELTYGGAGLPVIRAALTAYHGDDCNNERRLKILYMACSRLLRARKKRKDDKLAALQPIAATRSQSL